MIMFSLPPEARDEMLREVTDTYNQLAQNSESPQLTIEIIAFIGGLIAGCTNKKMRELKEKEKRIENPCPKCGAPMQCLSGSSAHPNNWYCTDIEGCGYEAWNDS